MTKPTEHKTVQARILGYAQEIGWTVVPREEAEQQRGFDPALPVKERADLVLIDYDDPANNVYEVTEEWAFHNGHYGTRQDVVFLINRIPVLVIECKNASKDEAIALKVINLVKSIEKVAEESSDDPYLVAMAERAQAVQESFEQRQATTAEALAELLKEVELNEARKKVQAEKSFDGLTYFVYRTLLDANIANAENVSRKLREAFSMLPNWRRSDNALRELRQKVTFAIFAETDDLNQVSASGRLRGQRA